MFLILDGNNLAWAGYYGLERAMRPADDERRLRVASLGLAGMVLGAIARSGEPPNSKPRTPVTRVALCFDQGRPLRRREFYPPYQTGREGDPKFIENEPTILSAIDRFCDVAKMLPIDVLHGENTEADDLIAGLVQRHPDLPKRIVSTDRDFLQLISPHTSVYAPVKKLIIDETNFDAVAAPANSSGVPVVFPRERYLDFRALVGDPSDNIGGVTGLGPLSAARLLRKASIDSYFGKPQAVHDALERRNLAVEAAFRDGSARATVERNRILMDLRRPAPCWDVLDDLTTRGMWQPAPFQKWFEGEKISAVENAALTARLESLAAQPSP